MFTSKKTQLFASAPKKVTISSVTTPTNPFLQQGLKKSAETRSGNNALKYETTGNEWVDQFGKLGSFRSPRSFQNISVDCATLYALDQELFVKFTIYIRMISRKTDLFFLDIKTQEAQVGAELRNEGIMRMLWLYTKNPQMFWDNIGLFISAGCCKDIFQMLRYDLAYHGWDGRVLDWRLMGNLIMTMLENPNTVNLIKKYLPQIKANSKCMTVESQANNIVAKFLCSLIFGGKTDGGSYREYRRLKVSGTAHTWQQLISRREFDRIDFSRIHGRALNLLIKSKFLKNQNLQEKYGEWLGEAKTVKYTGYVHELFCELDKNNDPLFVETVNKQFAELVEKVKNGDENLTSMIVVRDTSASMGSLATGTKFSCYSIGKSLALYFSEFLTGKFANSWIEFNNTAQLHEWKGSTPAEKWQADRSGYVGGTNFLSVIQLMCQIKSQGVSENDFPRGIICISDSEFNPAELGQTNVEAARNTLKQAGFSYEFAESFKIVLWNLQSRYYGARTGEKFETFGDVKNVYYMSGYSASAIKFILNEKVDTAADLFNAAMDQELLHLVGQNNREKVLQD